MTTFGQGGKIIPATKIDGGADEDQLAPPPELMEVDPDPYGDNEPGTPVIEGTVEVADDPKPVEDQVAATQTPVADAEDAKRERLEKLRAELAAAEAELAPEPEGNAVALVEKWDVKVIGEVWPYDFLEFEGDLLGVRLPQKQALAAFSLASSKYVSMGVKNDLTGLFIARHLSPESYGRVFSRLMDPDDAAYDVETVGELFNAIVTASVEADSADEKTD